MPDPKLALTNRMYVSEAIFRRIAPENTDLHPFVNIRVNGLMFSVRPDKAVADNEIAMNVEQRKYLGVSVGDPVTLTPMGCSAKELQPIAYLTLTIDSLAVNVKKIRKVEYEDLYDVFIRTFLNQPLTAGQCLLMDVEGEKFSAKIASMSVPFGYVSYSTKPTFEGAAPTIVILDEAGHPIVQQPISEQPVVQTTAVQPVQPISVDCNGTNVEVVVGKTSKTITISGGGDSKVVVTLNY